MWGLNNKLSSLLTVSGSDSDSASASDPSWSWSSVKSATRSPKLTWKARHHTDSHLRSDTWVPGGRVSVRSVWKIEIEVQFL